MTKLLISIFTVYNLIMRCLYFLLLAIISFLPGICLGQISFSASPTKGCDSLNVRFVYTGSVTVEKALWNFGNGKTSSLIDPDSVLYSKTGVYTVSLTVNDSLKKTVQGMIQIRPSPVAYFNYSDTLDPGTFNYIFRALPQPVDTAKYSYQWKYSGSSSADTSNYLFHQFDSTGLYPVKLIVTDDFGCSDTVVRQVNVSEKLYVPNVFTPNNDGINDYMDIPVNGQSMYRLMIFSRYGILIYRTTSYYPQWDGTNTAGVKMHEGIYFYTIESLDEAHPLRQSGFVYLLLNSK